MSAKAIYEATGKDLLNRHLSLPQVPKSRFVVVEEQTDWQRVVEENQWLLQEKLVVKPDQLIKRRGKLGLIKINADLSGVRAWIDERMNKNVQVERTTGRLHHFIVEPFLPHEQEHEVYLCIHSHRHADTILFHHEGGIDIGDVDSKALKLDVPIDEKPSREAIVEILLKNLSPDSKELVTDFIVALYDLYVSLHFTYLEINPLVLVDGRIHVLDLAAKLDATADFLCKSKWGEIPFPPAFGRDAFPEEAYVADLDARSGASLKLTILNRHGRIWTMVAGGGASVIYSDTVCELGGASELANYGEYSGAPTEMQTYEYARTLLSLMTADAPAPEGKILLVGGGIANFTNVAATFKGIVKALVEYRTKLVDHRVSIFVRRAGPNYQEGLRVMREVGGTLGVPIHVFGPETHMTAIVAMAMGKERLPEAPEPAPPTTANFLLPGGMVQSAPPSKLPRTDSGNGLSSFADRSRSSSVDSASFDPEGGARRPLFHRGTRAIVWGMQNRAVQGMLDFDYVCSRDQCSVAAMVYPFTGDHKQKSSSVDSASFDPEGGARRPLFHRGTRAIVWGMQNRAVQGMLDFDYVCSRDQCSVAAMVYPFTGDHKQKFYWGHKEILIPVYKNMADAMRRHKDADVMISFASLRSAYESTLETMQYPQIRVIAIIAEGIPENMTRKMNKMAAQKGVTIIEHPEDNAVPQIWVIAIIAEGIPENMTHKMAAQKGVTIIGPATVGGIKPGCFKIGNTGGMMDNILASRLHRPGSVAYVSRSGGMSNELNNIVSRNTDGVYEGVAIGGDRYPGTTFLDHLLRYQSEPDVKMMVLLGEVGGTEEYDVCAALRDGRITKPLVAWCIGTCAGMLSTEVQFGHAGACAQSERETARAKNAALAGAGAYVPDTFDNLGKTMRGVFEDLVERGEVVPQPEVPPPAVPMDYSWARELGLIRKPASFLTSICDERGQEPLYAGTPISSVIREDLGIGGVLGLLWFQRRLPPYAAHFLERVLVVTADHGPAVSGAHNTIVCARAGKDLVSSLVSGLLTIGDRFGGALDAAARMFSEAYDSGMLPMEFVNSMRRKGQLIMGIGHRVKSINNPDQRVQILKEYAKEHFPATPVLDYALQVEKITTSKKPNLILNVDGLIGACVVDLLRCSGLFTPEEAQEYIEIGALNGLFVLGRTVGFIGHYLDQRRLKQGLYRHPWDDISYILPEALLDEEA